MTFLMAYVLISLIIGAICTGIAWEEDRKARAFESAITLVGMIICFAGIWPLMAFALLWPERK